MQKFLMKDIFDKIETKKLSYLSSRQPKHPTISCSLPAITSGIDRQGRTCYIPKENATILKNCITIASNGDAGTAFYQPDEFTILQDSYALQLKEIYQTGMQENVYLYLITAINQVTKPTFSYTNKCTCSTREVRR